MHTMTRYPLLILWLSTLLSLGAASAETGGAQVDLGKTLELFQGWSQRKGFPDSVPLAYYNAYSLQALQGSISPEIRTRLVDFVKSCQDEGGGLVSNPKFPGAPNVIYTYYALKTLDLLKALDSIDQAKALGFIQGLMRDDGSIAPSAKELNRATLASTFYGVASLQMLGKRDLVARDKTVAYVMAHRTSDDGFGVQPKGAPSPQAVSMAVQTLALLDALNKEVTGGTVRYLEGAMGLLGLQGKRHRAFSTMQAAADNLTALVAMKALGEVETSPILAFVESLYIPQNGGFGPSPGFGTSPPSTYLGVYCLQLLGKLPKPAAQAAGMQAPKSPV